LSSLITATGIFNAVFLLWPFLCMEDCDISSNKTKQYDELIHQWGKGMIKLLTRKIFLWVFFLVGVGMVAPLNAQQKLASQGNIIKRVSTSSQKGASILLIRGALVPGQLSDISIVKKGATSYVISIPNALIDPEKIPKSSQKFSLRDPIKNINFTESIQEKGDDVVFTVDLEVETRKEFKLGLLKPITSTTIRIKLDDMEMIAKKEQAAEEKTKEKKESEEKVRQMATKKKEETQMKSRRTTAKAQKTVTEVLQQYQRPSIMQLSIINASGWAKRAYKLSVFLGREKKKDIEESLGIKLDIVNISNAKNDRHNQSTIYFRDNFLKPALFLARLIPGEQKLVPISSKRKRLGVDIEIYLGMDFK
jgi:hypothetical protein